MKTERRAHVGKANRERRASKKRKQERRSGGSRIGESRTAAGGAWAGSSDGPDVRFALITAATVIGRGADEDDSLAVVEAFLAVAGQRGSSGTALVVDEVFCECLHEVFEGGWQPKEVVKAVRRRRDEAASDLVCTGLAAYHAINEAEPPERWASQLRELGADDAWWGRGRDWLGPWALRTGRPWSEALVLAVGSLAVLLRLPRTQVLMDPPSEWRRTLLHGRVRDATVDDAVLAKVRALLAKAESTAFEHEADALTAKAQELIARHSIDEALANQTATRDREAPTATRISVDDPYANAKSSLLGVVAATNGVRAVWDEEYGLMTLIGFGGDLESVEMLFTSLLMQASKAMLAKGQVRDERGRSRTRSFRQSFYVAFAQRIHERLEMAASQARSDVEADLGMDLLPVLAGRRDEVDEQTAKLFPHLSKAKMSRVTNRDGWLAGRAAAEMATLGPVRERLEGSSA